MINILIIILSIFLGSLGQITLKHGMNTVGRITSADLNRLPELILRVGFNPFILLGLFIFGMSAVVWLVVLSRMNVSVAYPFASLAYFFVLLMSWLFLGEKITVFQVSGVFMIWLGLFIVTR